MGCGKDPTIAVVFVNFHSEALIMPRAMALISAGLPVVVADNSATFPDGPIRRVQMDGNEGFGAGCNRGVESLPADVNVVCFHNPDADAHPDQLRTLRAALDAQPRGGAVAPAERVGALTRDRGYHYPGFGRELALATRQAWGWRSPGSAPAPPRPPQTRGGRGQRFAGGFLLVVSRAAHEVIGGFDEQFFLYMEDLDYWHRLGLAGFQTEFEPSVVIDHASGTGSPLDSVEREVLRWIGIELFAEKSGHDWRPYRSIHRPLLSLAPAPVAPLVEEIRSRWHDNATPFGTSERVRSFVRYAEAGMM